MSYKFLFLFKKDIHRVGASTVLGGREYGTWWARVRYLVGASTVSGPVHTNYHLVGICSFFMNVTFSPPPAFGEKAISQEISLKLFIWRLNSLSAPS